MGDTASLDQDGKPLPGVAQVAIQQGHYAGRLIRSRITGSAPPPSFRYFDKGSLAVVGKGFAILQTGKVRQRIPGVAGLGSGAPRIPRHIQSASERLRAMGVDLFDRAAGFTAHCEPLRGRTWEAITEPAIKLGSSSAGRGAPDDPFPSLLLLL